MSLVGASRPIKFFYSYLAHPILNPVLIGREERRCCPEPAGGERDATVASGTVKKRQKKAHYRVAALPGSGRPGA
ncbi:hypothetical protein NDU88_005652 [Pleurodeles waltl]|uniref:Uncharacterized protein n=1 Tax=Pleurodeles waltl TaxID=8319 RepID=A0AAV7N161_PLEWA|nr:hypothetical protein NDU88_005652 [Pleurodeles waltl]